MLFMFPGHDCHATFLKNIDEQLSQINEHGLNSELLFLLKLLLKGISLLDQFFVDLEQLFGPILVV